MFVYNTVIKLHETDAAGLLFFSHQFKLMHDAYEQLLDRSGFGFAVLIREKDYFLPIVHAEADYMSPLFVGDPIEIQVTVENIGTTSFTFGYKILNARQDVVGTGKTVHVTMDKKTSKKITLPADFRAAVAALSQKSSHIGRPV